MALDPSQYSLLAGGDYNLGGYEPPTWVDDGTMGDASTTGDKSATLRKLAQLMASGQDPSNATPDSVQPRGPAEQDPGLRGTGSTWSSTDPAAMAKGERQQRQLGAEAGVARAGAKIIKAIVAAAAGGAAAGGGGVAGGAAEGEVAGSTGATDAGVAGGMVNVDAGTNAAAMDQAGFGSNVAQGYQSGGGTGMGGFVGRLGGQMGGGGGGGGGGMGGMMGGGGGGGMGGMKMPSMGQDVSAAVTDILTAGKKRRAQLFHEEALGSGESDVGGTAVPWAG